MMNIYNCDCLQYMKQMKDDFFDLSIVDPPYGIGKDWTKNKSGVHYNHDSCYDNSNIPPREYFIELKRISKNQIIWGGNYYTEHLEPRNSWIIWDKKRDYTKTHMSEVEMAWTSFNIPARIYQHIWDGGKKGKETGIKKIHPHQKPIRLYKWILDQYAKPGWNIFDSHMGSGSLAIACHDLKYNFTGCEIEKQYFDSAAKRIKEHSLQLTF